MSELKYDLFREVFEIVEWKDGAVYLTETRGLKWIPEEEFRNNRPQETNLIYVPANMDQCQTLQEQNGIRLRREEK
jgi:hypothetical protein